ncbi:NAD-dependent SIR2 family protein deacetylase [Hydrogenophaga palleronii]|uniref:NAD-dependent SIR2 family protein deacetylase n=1 Tax=Hydrogenophaga palleronii TaxID=65655 RepID=A0ABU1WTQ2_9BURK|nr:DUF4259 domain-containing protein [Hydrogenophaga palleronii]MDR7152653.1 NAD-dependent SIR2 family protein deacetylase [Hydrogenophaga palleronii]
MGTWSHEPFGNDDANDWAYDLEEVQDLSLVEQALDQALDAEEYLEAPEGSNAVAAVEVLAKLLGQGTQSDAYTEKVDEWVKSAGVKPSTELLEKAKRALVRVAGENSELQELWAEAGSDEWIASIKALQVAISAPQFR